LTNTSAVRVFFINTEKRALAQPDSQILVLPAQLPFLRYPSFVNAHQENICNTVTCCIEEDYGKAPVNLIDAIREHVPNSLTLSQRCIDSILHEFV
jgi:hypothetical protein